ncbi:Hypothetical protein CINCED_3A022810 [Cinara cedri]|uniref:Uncharacterized protein n=1 Tax=Cinara cedri TaxID=506608 RepID=A0A5E4NCK3_9HEMI|nr:Hypothetical protein CINCED_3A022810 [Cinara cedri]
MVGAKQPPKGKLYNELKGGEKHKSGVNYVRTWKTWGKPYKKLKVAMVNREEWKSIEAIEPKFEKKNKCYVNKFHSIQYVYG